MREKYNINVKRKLSNWVRKTANFQNTPNLIDFSPCPYIRAWAVSSYLECGFLAVPPYRINFSSTLFKKSLDMEKHNQDEQFDVLKKFINFHYLEK